MATESPNPPEGFTKADEPDNNQDDDYDTEWADKPQLGEMIQGTLLAHKPDAGDYDGLLEVRLSQPYGDFDAGDLIAFWSTSGINATLEANGLKRGQEFAVACDETVEIDGEEKRNYTVYTEDS